MQMEPGVPGWFRRGGVLRASLPLGKRLTPSLLSVPPREAVLPMRVVEPR